MPFTSVDGPCWNLSGGVCESLRARARPGGAAAKLRGEEQLEFSSLGEEQFEKMGVGQELAAESLFDRDLRGATHP